MIIRLLLRTVRYLKPTQVFFQMKYRLKKPAYVAYDTSGFKIQDSGFKTEPIPKFKSVEGNIFTFLNLEHEFAGWNFTDNGMLWAYNQNYFDWINQEGFSEEEGCKWIDQFIGELPDNKVGLDPYPIALRSINWVKFFSKYPESATKARLNSLYSQVKLLEKKLEYHLLGNHLLEDAYALYIGASYFKDDKLLKKAKALLLSQLKEQILPDGAHYEQSPMYHCILLDRLLDCININASPELEQYAIKMLGHLESVKWGVGDLPLLNDSANGIAPTTSQLFYYAKSLGLKWNKIPMKECGYRKMMAGGMEAIVDVGDVTTTYQPGHTHADSLNYELRIDGRPFVVDCGISTYNKTERRQYERGTAAHNCVVANGKDSSEVWSGFRVGKRAKVTLEHGFPQINHELPLIISATHNGYPKPCKRLFTMEKDKFIIEDWYDGVAVSYVHIAEGADEKRVKVDGDAKVEIKPWKYSTEYNRFKEGKEIKITFKDHLKYTIK